MSFGLKFVPCVKKLKIKQNIARNTNFTLIGFLDQKRAVIFKKAVFVLNSVRNNQLLEFWVFCHKRKQNNNLTKYSLNLMQGL